MSETPLPLDLTPDDHLEARITAWVLGEASPFEQAELEELVKNSPELKLFLNRTRALHGLLTEAETTSNTPDEEWQLPAGKKIKLARRLGETPEIPHLPVPERNTRRASTRAAIGIAACVAITFFIIRFFPSGHEAEAIIEIKLRERSMEPFGPQSGDTMTTLTPQFFGTEFEKIKSRNLLGKVVDDLDLTTRWNTDKESALRKLRDSVETENIRDTDLVAIRVRQPDENDAKRITRAIVAEYRDYRTDLEDKMRKKGINELAKALREQEDKVEERRKILTTISRTKDIVYYGDQGMGRNPPAEDTKSSFSENEYNRQQAEIINLDTQIEGLRKYDDEQLLTYASGLDLPDNTVKNLYPQYLEAKRQVDGLRASGLAENDPSVKTHDRVIESMKQDLDHGVENLQSRLEGNLEISKERLAKVQIKKNEDRRDAMERNIDTQDYVDSKRDFETEQALLEQMKMKLVGSEISAAITPESIVVHDMPAAPEPTIASYAAAKKSTPPPPSEPIQLDANESGERSERSADFRRRVVPSPASQPPPAARARSGSERSKSSAGKKESPAIPVPDQLASQMQSSADFGDGDDFGGGWGESNSRSLPAKPNSPFAEGAVSDFLSAGIRSGDAAIARNNIDAILNNPERGLAANDSDDVGGSGAGRDEGKQADAKNPPSPGQIQRRPNPPANAFAKVKAANSASPTTIPVPTTDLFADADMDHFSDSPSSPPPGPRPETRFEPRNTESFDTALAEAKVLRKTGRYDEARKVLDEAAQLDPSSPKVIEELGYLDNPIRSNPALTYEHAKDVDEVRRKLYEAQGNLDLGKTDNAKSTYEEVLRIDPYNSAARRGMERIAAKNSDYYRAAYDNTRAELLMQVDDAWELSVPADDPGLTFFDGFVNYGAPIVGKAERNADFSPQPEAESRLSGRKAGESSRQAEPEPDAAVVDELKAMLAGTEFDVKKVEEKLSKLKARIEAPSINDSNKQALFAQWQQLQAEAIAKQEAQKPIRDSPTSPRKPPPPRTPSLPFP